MSASTEKLPRRRLRRRDGCRRRRWLQIALRQIGRVIMLESRPSYRAPPNTIDRSKLALKLPLALPRSCTQHLKSASQHRAQQRTALAGEKRLGRAFHLQHRRRRHLMLHPDFIRPGGLLHGVDEGSGGVEVAGRSVCRSTHETKASALRLSVGGEAREVRTLQLDRSRHSA